MVALNIEVNPTNAGVYRYPSPLSLFSPMKLLGPGPTLERYWLTQRQSPAPAASRDLHRFPLFCTQHAIIHSLCMSA